MRIIIISPYFAPVSSVGAARMTSLVRFLKERHTITVVTFADTYYQRNKGIVRKTPLVEGIRYVYFDPIYPEDYVSHKREVEQALFMALSDELNKEKYDVMLVSCGPVFTEKPVRKAGIKYKLPYIIDFRDLDNLDYFITKEEFYRDKSMVARLRRIIHNFVFCRDERMAVNKAEKLIVANPAHKDILLKKYHLDTEKVLSITNGFDDYALMDLELPGKDYQENRFIIGIFGKVIEYDKGRTRRLFQIIKTVNEKYKNILIWHVGSSGSETENLAYEVGLSKEQFVNFGVMDYKAAMKIMSQVDMFAMVFTHPNSLGTKTYDYIYLNKPVLSVTPFGRTAIHQVFQNFCNCCISDDDKVIEQFICHIIDDHVTILDENYDCMQYARSSSNKLFEEILKIHKEAGNDK